MITVVGGGFAGVEAAWGIAQRGEKVRLVEMRPHRRSPAHQTDWLAELVCSNSLKSASPTSPAGLLKEEMDALGSIVLEVARETSVPGGEALCVDRALFAEGLSRRLEAHPNVELIRREASPDAIAGWMAEGPVILATGPLTTPEVSDWIAQATGREHLYFYDAVSPTVEASSLDRSIVFAQSRYDKKLAIEGGEQETGSEEGDYLNCPFDKSSYEAFVEALIHAERAPIHAFEAGGVRTETVIDEGYALGAQAGGTGVPPVQGATVCDQEAAEDGDSLHRRDADATLEDRFLEKIKYFAGCTPIEAIAEKGARSLAFGNFKPIGLTDPRTGRRPWAALQLRPENAEKTLYSLVACQTRLKFGEQRRIFRMVPGLENAEFVRYGVIHRNTYVEAPTVLGPNLEMRAVPGLFLSGQLTGVEGYVESAAMGIVSAIATLAAVRGTHWTSPARTTALGALLGHLADETPREFAPMNINWGLLPEPLDESGNPFRDKGAKRAKKLATARADFAAWLGNSGYRNGQPS